MKNVANTKDSKIMKWVEFGMFPGGMMFIQNMSHKEVSSQLRKGAAKELKKCKDVFKSENPTVLRFQKGSREFLMVFQKGCDLNDLTDVVTLAHECLHICQMLLPDFLNRDEEQECEAYFHSYLMDTIIGILKKPPR